MGGPDLAHDHGSGDGCKSDANRQGNSQQENCKGTGREPSILAASPFPSPALRVSPAGGGAGGVFGFDLELGEVDLAGHFGLGGFEAGFKQADALFEEGDAGFGLVGAAGAGDLGVAELAVSEGGGRGRRGLGLGCARAILPSFSRRRGWGTWVGSRGCGGVGAVRRRRRRSGRR